MEIKLSGKHGEGRFAILDKRDYQMISKHTWFVRNNRNKYFYAARKDKGKIIMMHRIINQTPIGMETDHINHNTLDNRRNNLRTVTHSKNQMNREINSNNVSGKSGVCWIDRFKKWVVHININKKKTTLGYYKNFEDAVLVRTKAERVYYGNN